MREVIAMFRDLARAKQALSREESTALLIHAKRGMLSVLGDEGYPYVLPINHWYCEEDGKIYFHSGMHGHKIDAIQHCSKASFCVLDEGTAAPDSWWLTFKSVIVFGTIEIVADHETALEITRKLSWKFTQDEDYIQRELEEAGGRVLVFALVPEHITGKRVTER